MVFEAPVGGQQEGRTQESHTPADPVGVGGYCKGLRPMPALRPHPPGLRGVGPETIGGGGVTLLVGL